jgi:predicted nuclease with TOPRIM domain
MYEEDLQKLIEENNKKDIKIKELTKNNENNLKIIQNLEAKIEELSEENNYFNEYIKNLRKENKSLEEFKSSIFDSIKTNEIKCTFKESENVFNNNDSGFVSKVFRQKKKSMSSEISSLINEKNTVSNFNSTKGNSKILKDKDRVILPDRR